MFPLKNLARKGLKDPLESVTCNIRGCLPEIKVSIHSEADGRLTARAYEVSKSQDSGVDFFNRSEIWRASRQQFCRVACHISAVRGTFIITPNLTALGLLQIKSTSTKPQQNTTKSKSCVHKSCTLCTNYVQWHFVSDNIIFSGKMYNISRIKLIFHKQVAAILTKKIGGESSGTFQ